MIAENAIKRYSWVMTDIPTKALRGAEIPALLVSDLTNIRYLTNVEVSMGLLLITARSVRLFVDSRYIEAAQKNSYRNVTVIDLDRLPSVLKRVRRCGYEENHVTVARFSKWKRKFKNTKFIRTSGIIEEFRRQKDARELRMFKKAQEITRQMLKRVPRVLKSAITEQELAWKLETWARELGAEGLSFEPVVAFGTHTSCPHHHPTDRKLRKGNLVQIDVGARYGGYCADQSEVFFTAAPTKKQQLVLSALKEAQTAAMDAVRKGVTTNELDRIACEILNKYGLEKYFTHSLGHGVGLEIHEGVSLNQSQPSKELLKGEIVTIEPGVYFPGKWGMRLEEEVIVK